MQIANKERQKNSCHAFRLKRVFNSFFFSNDLFQKLKSHLEHYDFHDFKCFFFFAIPSNESVTISTYSLYMIDLCIKPFTLLSRVTFSIKILMNINQ